MLITYLTELLRLKTNDTHARTHTHPEPYRDLKIKKGHRMKGFWTCP